MKDIFKLKTDIPESKEPVLPVSLKTGSKIEGRIEFRNLSFSYPIAGETKPVSESCMDLLNKDVKSINEL
jgi:hypothetical protein